MRNNYEKLTSPKDKSGVAVLNLKRLGKSSIRASFRMSKRMKSKPILSHNIPLNRDLLPAFIPPKAAALLQIDLHFEQAKQSHSMAHSSDTTPLPPIKNATIRKKSVWANNSASKESSSGSLTLSNYLYNGWNKLFNLNLKTCILTTKTPPYPI